MQQKPAGDILDHRARLGGANFHQAQVLLRGKALARFRREARRGNRLDKQLGDLLGGSSIHLAIDANHSAEGRDRIASQSFLVGIEDGRAGCSSAGVGVFDDDDGGFLKLLRQLPACVQIDEVVKAELLALQLRCACDAAAGAVGIKRGALMRVFAVTQRLGQRKIDAQCGRKRSEIGRGGR